MNHHKKENNKQINKQINKLTNHEKGHVEDDVEGVLQLEALARRPLVQDGVDAHAN